jgi:hypothetical protein
MEWITAELQKDVGAEKTKVTSSIEYDDMRHLTNRVFHQIY